MKIAKKSEDQLLLQIDENLCNSRWLIQVLHQKRSILEIPNVLSVRSMGQVLNKTVGIEGQTTGIIKNFIQNNIKPESIIKTVGFQSYTLLERFKLCTQGG